MKYRKLRIVWSAVFGLAAVLLVTLWVRSYWWVDAIGVQETKKSRFLTTFITTAIGSERGQITFVWNGLSNNMHWKSWHSESYFDPVRLPGVLGIGYRDSGFLGRIVTAPHWLFLVMSAALAASPWIPRRQFSLRALLIAMTVAAIGLGWIVYSLRK